MDYTTIQATVSSLKAAVEISKAMLDLKVSSDVQTKILEMQGALMLAQNEALTAITSYHQLYERVKLLEDELKRCKDWKDFENRYALVNSWGSAAQVYAIKESESKGENPHYLCPNCFCSSKKAILNPFTSHNDMRVFMNCASCKASIDTGLNGVDMAKYVEDINKNG